MQLSLLTFFTSHECFHMNVTDEHRKDGFALKSNVRQKIEIDAAIAIIGKTETDIDFKKIEN